MTSSLLVLVLVVSSSVFILFPPQVFGGRPPRLIEVPADSVVPRNEPATLNCRADGDPYPQITWLKDGKPIRAGGLRNFLPSGALFFLRVRKDLDAGVYSCVATNTFGEVVSRNATLDVATLQTEFKTSPQNTWVAQGDTATLDCDPPKGNPEPKVTWKQNGNPIDVKANERYALLGPGTLSISQTRQSDEGRYQCMARNIVGSRQSTMALLRVTIRPSFTIRPANTSSLLGGEVSLSCVARGDPPPEVTWVRADGGPLPFKRVSFDEERFLMSNVSHTDSGVYNCIADNKAGSVTSSATISVLPLPKMTMTPIDIEIQPNATAYFGCEAVGDPSPTLFWLKEGGHTLVFQGSRQDRVQVTPQGTLQIDNVTERDEGHYLCAAMSLAGSVVQRVHLKVTPLEELPPPIVLMGPSNQTRPLGAVAVLPCIANGTPNTVITWYLNGDSFLLGHRVFTDDAGTLRINDLENSDSGLYECVASSRSGKYVWRSQLTVTSKELNRNGFQNSNGFDPVQRPPPPQKPYILNVDASSVTIAWDSAISQLEELNSLSLPSKSLILQPNFPSLDGNEQKSFKSGKNEKETDKSRSIEGEPSYIDDEYYTSGSGEERRKKRAPPSSQSSEADAFFKALEKPSRFNSPKLEVSESDEENLNRYGDVIKQIIDNEDETGEYEYTDGDDYDESGGGGEDMRESDSNLVIKSEVVTPTPTSTTERTTTSTTPTTTITTRKVPTTKGKIVSLVNPRQFVQPPQIVEPIITYKVEYYSTKETKSEWLLGATNVVEQTFTLHHLKSNAEYIFFIRSVSPEGAVSGPSPLSDPIRTLHVGSKSTELELVLEQARRKLCDTIVVILKNIYATSSTSLKIEWQIVSASEFVEGFYIYYRRIEPASTSGSYQMLTVLNAGTSTFQIVSLDKFATYQVFLVPFYKNVEGRASNYVNVSTLQDVPTAAPQLIEPTPVNSSALIVRWKAPPAAHHNGVILGYQLRVWQGSSLIGNKTVDSLTTSVVLNNLNPGQTYSLQIGSFTSKGIGIFSPMRTLHFRPEIPKGDPNKKEEIDNSIKTMLPKEEKGKSEKSDDKNENSKMDNNIPVIPSQRDFEGIAFGGAAVNANNNEVFSEAWFIALIGCIIFAMVLVFVFALYLRRCQIRTDGDKLKVSTTEIPDGSIHPHYVGEDTLWIDANQQKHQLSLKSVGMSMGLNNKGEGMNEYENANNYAVVEDRHSPIAYATTTLVNNNHNSQQKHKSSFSVFGGGDSLNPKNGLGGFGGYNKISSGGAGGGWISNGGNGHPHSNKTSSLNITSQEMKKPPWLLNSSPVNGVGSSIVFGVPPGVGGNNGPCSSSQSSSSHSSASSEALMKHNQIKTNGKLSLKSTSNGSYAHNNGDNMQNHVKRRRGSGSRPSSRGQGREDDVNEYMDMDDPDNFLDAQDAYKGSLNLGGHVLSTFQTPLPTRKHLVVDYSSGSPVTVTSSLSNQHQLQRLNSSSGAYEYGHGLGHGQLHHGPNEGILPQYAHPSHLRNHNHHTNGGHHPF